jgi:predicted  nucleic acid-binding Zn-ribbon protein
MQEAGQVKLLLELHELEAKGQTANNEKARQEIEESLDAKLLNRYRNLKARKGTAVAVLRNCTCSECMIMYPRTHEILRHKDFVHSCEFCGRLLVVA